MCPWNSPKLVRLTREAGYLPRASRPPEQTGPGPGPGRRPGSGWGAAAAPLGSGSERPDSDSAASPLDSDSDSAGAASQSPTAAFIPGTSYPALLDLMAMDEAAWNEFSRGSAIRRARRAGFLRNVAVALGNFAAPEAVPALVRALDDPEPLVRGHAAWALGRIGTAAAVSALRARDELERDSWVREELAAALAGRGRSER